MFKKLLGVEQNRNRNCSPLAKTEMLVLAQSFSFGFAQPLKIIQLSFALMQDQSCDRKPPI